MNNTCMCGNVSVFYVHNIINTFLTFHFIKFFFFLLFSKKVKHLARALPCILEYTIILCIQFILVRWAKNTNPYKSCYLLFLIAVIMYSVEEDNVNGFISQLLHEIGNWIYYCIWNGGCIVDMIYTRYSR